jgi:CubicO group peptidase (beta-lactamase class C family)
MKRNIAFACALISCLASFSQKIDNQALDSVISKADMIISTDNRVFFKNVESIIVYSEGRIRFEKYYNGYKKDSLHQIQSQTKSIVALLAGIAIDKGFIRDENEKVSGYFPEYFNDSDKLKSSVTIRDLLTMSAGFRWEEMLPLNDPGNDNMNMFNSNNWLNYALSRPMIREPFTEFKYNSGCPMIIGGIIEKASKMKLEEFAIKYLFEPLKIQEFIWLKDSTGFCHAGGGLFMKPIDIVKIGMLVMNKGKWENKQLISELWINKVITPYLLTSFDVSSYGFFWWIRDMKTNHDRTIKVLSAEGAGGQKLYIFPEYDLIVAFTERNYNTPHVSPLFINDSIIPILK